MEIRELVQAQKAFYDAGVTKNIETRLDALLKLYVALSKNEATLTDALHSDLNKSAFDAYSTEIGIILHEIRFMLKHLKSWAKPQKVKTPITHFGSKSFIASEPFGVALIISPWNYPIQLSFLPLVGALAAGNTVILKPSEYTPHTSECLEKVIKETFPVEYVAVIQGGVETSEQLLKDKVDKVFFTGGTEIGKIVMEACAKQLIPVTLELGGKSPCVIHDDANIKLTAKRVAWGKFMNAGQTCVAPDYVVVHEKIKDEFLKELKSTTKAMFCGQDATKIVNEKHFDRLSQYLNDGVVIFGGKSKREECYIEPTIITGISWSDPIMQDEIFGPILPVLDYSDLSVVVNEINKKPKPLAFYLFSENKSIQEMIIQQVSFGGGAINDTIYHMTSPYLPFGGIGSSGMGAYHGKYSFDTFSHKKSLLKQTTFFDIPFRYPNSKNGLKKIKWFLK